MMDEGVVVAGLVTHAPLWLERLVHGRLGEDLIAGQATDASSTAANGVGLSR